jgi:hypothetical protein
MLVRETVAVYCENHTEHINTLCGQNAETLYIRIQSVLHRKHVTSPLQRPTVYLLGEIIAVYFENHTKYKNTLSWQNAECVKVKVGGTYSYHCALIGER